MSLAHVMDSVLVPIQSIAWKENDLCIICQVGC